MPNCVLTCNMRNEFVAVKVYQAVKNPGTSASCRNKQCARIRGCCLQNSLIFIRFAKNISREFARLHNHHRHFVYYANKLAVLNMNIHDTSRNSVLIFCKWRLTSGFPTSYLKIKNMTKLLIQIEGGGWSGGAMILGKLPVPRRSTILMRARAYCACSRCGWRLFGHFYSPLSFLPFFSLFLGDGLI